MTIRDELAVIRERAENATEGPWVVTGNDIGAIRYSWDGPDLEGPIMLGQSGGFDLAFIAASRTDIPRLVSALQAVVDRHTPDATQCITGDCALEACEHEDKCPTKEFLICRECASIAEWANAYFGETSISEVKWPCSTIRAIEEAMEAGA